MREFSGPVQGATTMMHRCSQALGRNVMDIEPRESAASPPAVALDAFTLWIEILAPVEAASAVIAQAIQGMPSPPVGLSIAHSERSTILLNQAAWTALHPILKGIAGLQTQHSTEPVGSRAIKFSVLT
jgi:hypothetical protein